MRPHPLLSAASTVVLGLVVGLLGPSSSQAAWPPSGVAVGGTAARANNAQGIPDGSGGWYVVWEDHQVNASHPDIRLQHLSATGDPIAGWPASAIVVSGLPTDEVAPQLALDGS